MKAIILAAGMGTRIQKYTDGKPKCLLKINNKTILSHQIDNLVKAGLKLKDIIIVTGYNEQLIREECPSSVNFIYNKDYKTTNSLYSMWLARNEEFNNGMILLNADVIFHFDIIKKLIDNNQNSLAVDYNKKLINGEMNVIVNKKNEIIKISKQVKAENASGESAQIIKFNAESVKILFDECDKIITNGMSDKFPTYIFDKIIKSKKIYAVDVESLPWYEIDYNKDYLEAKKINF